MADGTNRRGSSTIGPIGRRLRGCRTTSAASGGAATGVEALADVDPASGETVALVPLSGRRRCDAAVAAARAAQPGWRAVPPQRRARAVLALREELLRRREELAALVSADMGKTLADADGEVGRGLESVESAAAIPHLLKGETWRGSRPGSTSRWSASRSAWSPRSRRSTSRR